MADPLGATQASPLDVKNDVVDVGELAVWSSTQPEGDNAAAAAADATDATAGTSPFPHDPVVAGKVILWSGDLTKLRVDAIVNPTNETLNEQFSLNRRITEAAGKGFTAECRTLRSCRTGEAKVTQAYNLPCRVVVHTVGPRFNERYRTAAESALFNCYRGSLQLVRESGLVSVAFPPVNSSRRGYPPEDGAHIALRTVRRFLERHGDALDHVVFCVTGEDEQVYKKLMPLYFPRSEAEAVAAVDQLPKDIGNEDGEPVVEERQIRITENPTALLKDGDHEDEAELPLKEEAGQDMISAFASMSNDPDEARRARISQPGREDPNVERGRRYKQWREKAKTEDLSSIAGLKFIYRAGSDAAGRPIIVFVARHFPAKNVDLKKALMYCINTMDSAVNQNYLIVYFHTQADSSNYPESAFLKDLYSIVDDRYRKNLNLVYIVHPTWWTKITSWFFTTFTVSGVKDKVRNVAGLQLLFDNINAAELDIPQFILDYDRQLHGPLTAPDRSQDPSGL
eukprot:m.484404 g.484404  ORF g.484404 m.484404 type:complete len:511 (+) comp23341_c0_seq1:278-1810(+)